MQVTKIKVWAWILLIIVPLGNAIAAETPIGLWKTHDDKGVATGYVRINEENGILTGVIEKGLETDKEEKYCHACKDERKDQRLIGLTMLKNVRAKGDAYEGSEILDPFSGNTYRVKLRLKDAGETLEVRGYIAMSLFGRTQIWKRAEHGQ